MINESTNEIYALKELSSIGKRIDIAAEDIAHIAFYLNGTSVKLCAKALWLLGEIGFKNPKGVAIYVADIARHLNSTDALLRERALNALGRIGRMDFGLTEPYLTRITSLSHDSISDVRLAFIWACENIAVNTPEVFADIVPTFASLLYDKNVRVRIEAPEIFRVLGKRKPEFVEPYLETLRMVAKSDENEVVRIHANGAIKAATQTR